MNANQEQWQKPKPFHTLHKFGRCTIIAKNVGRVKEYVLTYNNEITSGLEYKPLFKELREKIPRIRYEKRLGEIIAYRAWKIVGEYLQPVARAPNFEYDGPVLVADALPTKENLSGFWAVKAEHLTNVMRSYGPHCIGTVGLFGRVVEHEIGWRAEKMIIKELTLLIPATEKFCETLANKYECEVTIDVDAGKYFYYT